MNETNRDEVTGDILAWLQGRVEVAKSMADARVAIWPMPAFGQERPAGQSKADTQRDNSVGIVGDPLQ